VLRRLETTILSLRNWSSGRANATLHNWQVKEFLLITQCDLFNVQDCFEILQVHISKIYFKWVARSGIENFSDKLSSSNCG
jgi:hypothetical protein